MKLSDLSRWEDPKTGLLLAADGGRDNILVSTATALEFLYGEDRATIRERFLEFMKLVEKDPGLYAREPGSTGESSVDNLVAAAVISFELDTDHRFDIVRYAEGHGWRFNVAAPNEPSTKHSYGRFLGIPPFADVCIGRGLNREQQWLLAGATAFCGLSRRGDTSDKCLQLLINRVIEERYDPVDLGLGVFKNLMSFKYPGGQRELRGIYWGLEHPYTLASKTTF